MIDLLPPLLELIRLTSTSLPADVEAALRQALENEQPGSPAREALQVILDNVSIARESSVPICQDTGTPIFHIHHPESYPRRLLEAAIRAAVAEATARAYLRPNTAEALSGIHSGDHLGDAYFPFLHFSETDDPTLTIDLILKGGGCENVGRQYALPDEELNAGRDLEGLRKAALDCVWRAQGLGCAPGFLGIAVGGDRASSYLASKEIFVDPLAARSPDPQLAALEEQITHQANTLGIGPMGFGGNTTLLNTRITSLQRLPASCFVSISYMCWAYRRRRLTIIGESVSYA